MKIYYDGLCKVCNSEIQHYKKQIGAENIQFIDIFGDSFDAQAEGLDPQLIHKVMHVRRKDGTLVTKAEAFIAIWEELPRYHFVARTAKLPGIRKALDLGYIAFTKVRPLLPRHKAACQDSPYCQREKP